MRNHTLKTLALAVGISLAAVAFSASAHAGSLRQGSTGSSGSAVTGALPGEVLWTYYQTNVDTQFCPPAPDNSLEDDLCNTFSLGDNIIRLINPNGAANGNLAGAKTQTVCAMIYVFDDDEEMGECCGCPLSSAQLATLSVNQNLASNWGLQGTEIDAVSNGNGAIAVVAAASNVPVSFVPGLSNGQGCGNADFACNGGCDPTNTPGYSVTTASNLLGSVTHQQAVYTGCPVDDPMCLQIVRRQEITETALSDDAGGDPTNLTYLQTQCGALVGNGTGGGICNCPIE